MLSQQSEQFLTTISELSNQLSISMKFCTAKFEMGCLGWKPSFQVEKSRMECLGWKIRKCTLKVENAF